jgi:TRAP-type C4-dicarboxylate transport system permease small subunit
MRRGLSPASFAGVAVTRFVHRLANLSAMLGGIVLILIILMTCVSIIGRALIPLGLAPIPGDYELVEAGVAFAVFSFLPLAQIQVAHATVDIFTSMLSLRANRIIVAFWELVATAVLIFIAARLWEGMLGKLGNGETSMFLQFPIWWSYALCMVPAVIGVIVGLWSAWDRIRAALTGRETRPLAGGAEH